MIKVGDLVRTKFDKGSTIGLVTEVFQKKHWDTGELGKTVNWDTAPERDFAKVLSYGGREYRFLLDDLEILPEK